MSKGRKGKTPEIIENLVHPETGDLVLFPFGGAVEDIDFIHGAYVDQVNQNSLALRKLGDKPDHAAMKKFIMTLKEDQIPDRAFLILLRRHPHYLFVPFGQKYEKRELTLRGAAKV